MPGWGQPPPKTPGHRSAPAAPRGRGGAARAQAREGVTADWVVAAQGPGVPGEAARLLRARHDTVTEVVRTTVRVGLDKYSAQGVTPAGLTRTWDPEVTAGSLADLAPAPSPSVNWQRINST